MAAAPREKQTVDQLKAECKKFEIAFSSRAKKADLVALLDGYDKMAKLTTDDLSKKLKEHGLPSSGTKPVLIKRLVRYEEYTALTPTQLQALARSKGLSDQGTKEELMKRLLVKAPKEAPSPKAKGKAEKKADKADKPAGQGSPAAEHKAPAARKTKKGKPAPQVKIASWNLCNLVEQSRHKKYNVIAQLFEDYDLVAVQEVIHKEGLDEIKKLLVGWDYVSSHASVGRVRKEFYAFFYRTDRISVLASGQFDDTAKDVFEREPFVATFKVADGNFDFTLISIHVLWGNSVVTRRQELTHFADVIKAVLAQNKGERDVMLMGDFNFGPEDPGWAELKALGYKPTILPPEKTTVGSVSLFDNIWLSEKYTSNDWTGESGVVHWDETMYGKETLKARNEVSDHRPVWAKFWTTRDEDDGTVGKLEGLKI